MAQQLDRRARIEGLPHAGFRPKARESHRRIGPARSRRYVPPAIFELPAHWSANPDSSDQPDFTGWSSAIYSYSPAGRDLRKRHELNCGRKTYDGPDRLRDVVYGTSFIPRPMEWEAPLRRCMPNGASSAKTSAFRDRRPTIFNSRRRLVSIGCFKKGQATEFTQLVIGARTPAELEQRTKTLERGTASCERLNDEMCIPIPRAVAVNLFLPTTVNGNEVMVRWGANVGEAIREAGVRQPGSVLPTLAVYKPYNGRPAAVDFDRTSSAILKPDAHRRREHFMEIAAARRVERQRRRRLSLS